MRWLPVCGAWLVEQDDGDARTGRHLGVEVQRPVTFPVCEVVGKMLLYLPPGKSSYRARSGPAEDQVPPRFTESDDSTVEPVR